MSDERDRLRARARLALRAERAFGLGFVVRTHSELVPPEAVAPVVERAPSAVAAASPPQESKRAGIDLFGSSAAPLAKAETTIRLPLEPFSSPELTSDGKRQQLQDLDEREVRGCTRCRLCERRTNTVFGEGSADAKLVFIGEGPGENEDLSGRPFVGKAGQLLDKMIVGMGLRREDVYIANVVKCRPPGNRTPSPDEVATCTPYLERQLEIIRPRVIVTLGLPATQHMLQSKLSMSRMRGNWHEWRGIKLMPTFHPAYLLRSYTRQNREMVWSDLQQAMRELGLPIRKRGDD